MYNKKSILQETGKNSNVFRCDHWIYELEITTSSKQNLISFFKEQTINTIKKNIRYYDIVLEINGKIYVVLESIYTTKNAKGVLIRLTNILENSFVDEVFIKSNHIEFEDIDFELLTKITESKDYVKNIEQINFLKMIHGMVSDKTYKNIKQKPGP